MINGTGSNFKKMTYNNSNSGKSTGRNNYSGNHNLGPNHLQSNNNNPIPNSAMAALMNPSIAAAMINPYAMSGLQGQPPNRHQQQLGYISFPYPSASDPIRPPPYFHAQSGHAVRITIEGSYSKALQGSLSQSNSGTGPSGVGLPNMPGSSSNLSGNLYHHKGQNSPHFQGGNGPRNMGLNSGNMRGISKNGPPPNYSNRHNQPYQNSRMPSNTSSSSPPVTSSGSIQHNTASTNGSTSISSGNNASNNVTSSISASGANALSNSVTNGNGNATPDKSPLDISPGSSISKTNLYIRGLTPNTTDKDLHSLCSPYGNIISTKAILDKETNKCRGYGFVDFEHPISAENAVKSLLSQGVQAQMAKCTDTNRNKNPLSKSINEHDPTNLYIANLPLTMSEADLDAMLSMYGSVVSTRILKDSNGTPRGVGFARMESKEKCDSIIGLLNGKMLPGSKDTLLVKFADGGNKKKHYKNDHRYRNDVDLQMGFDSTNLATNGVPTQLLPSPLGAANAYQRAFSATSYQNALQGNPWLHQGPPQYIMQPQMLPSNMDPNTALQYSPIMHQLTAQMSHLQLGGVSGAGYMPGQPHAYGTQAIYPPQLLQSMPLSGEQQQQEQQINPSHSVSSGSASGEEQQHTFQQMCFNQQK